MRSASATSPLWWNALPRSRAWSLPGQREVDVLVLVEDRLLFGSQHVEDEILDLRARHHRPSRQGLQTAVDPDPAARNRWPGAGRNPGGPRAPAAMDRVVRCARVHVIHPLVCFDREFRSARPRGPGASITLMCLCPAAP